MHKISLIDLQTTEHRINELNDFMDAYISDYLTHGSSEMRRKLYFLNLTKQQEPD